ncbi:MAG: CerR family C-terminal domain-containing protein [bacterium]
MTAVEMASRSTKQRLLEAGGEVFAEHGFRDATVREICQRAGANIAAVNYHFGDKERLYAAVWQYAVACAIEKYPPHLRLSDDATAEERLDAFIQSFLLGILDEGRPSWLGKLRAREMAEPTKVLDTLVEEAIRPRHALLMSIVRDLAGPGVSDEEIRLCAFSIVGQCLHYFHCQPVISRLYPQQKYGSDDIERLADHVTRFSLAALRHLSDEKRGDVR